MLYSRSLLVIYFIYSSVYLSISNSQSIPLNTPSSLVTISAISKSVSLILFCKYVHLYHLFFKNSAYKWYHMISVFLWLTSLSMIISGSIHVAANFIHFNGWVIFHCIYVPHLLYLFICRWTFSLLLCLGYCKWQCNEHWGACILLNHGFLCIAGWYGSSIFSF